MRQKEICNELTEEKKTEAENLDKSVGRDKDKLIYKYNGNTSDVGFNEYISATDIINKIKDGDVSLRKAVNDKYGLKLKVGEMKKGNPKRKSKSNLNIIKNDDNIYKSRQAAIDFFFFFLSILKEFQKLKIEQSKNGQDLKY